MSPESAKRARKILIVEDEALVALGVSGLVEEMGHHVCGIASSVAEALELSRAYEPDLVLMDVNLQEGGNGIDAAHQLRAFEQPPVVIFVTSQRDAGIADRVAVEGEYEGDGDDRDRLGATEAELDEEATLVISEGWKADLT